MLNLLSLHSQCQHFLFYPQIKCGFSPHNIPDSLLFLSPVDWRACHPRPSVPLQCAWQPWWADSGWEVFQRSYGSPNLEQTLTFYQWEHTLPLSLCIVCSVPPAASPETSSSSEPWFCVETKSHPATLRWVWSKSMFIPAVLTFVLLLLDMFVCESESEVVMKRSCKPGITYACFVLFFVLSSLCCCESNCPK